ncbi:50S ribosomal protein L4 [Candidatus Peribacteria bacterium]|nr:50S ribosomal protein L4 [Candidatus Peribacteria bacterium]
MNMNIYDMHGAVTGTQSLDSPLFVGGVNQDLLHRAVVLRHANGRQPIAHVITRGEVDRSKKKAFRQKGTGNARRGSMTTHLVRGGGAAFGPRAEQQNWVKQMNKKERRAALMSALRLRAADGAVFGLQTGDIDTPKTKPFVTALAVLPTAKRYLFVLPRGSYTVQKSVANLPNVQTILASYLNPTDVLLCDQVCFVNDALDTVTTTFLS